MIVLAFIVTNINGEFLDSFTHKHWVTDASARRGFTSNPKYPIGSKLYRIWCDLETSTINKTLIGARGIN